MISLPGRLLPLTGLISSEWTCSGRKPEKPHIVMQRQAELTGAACKAGRGWVLH